MLTTRDALRMDLKKIRGTAKNFAMFGAAFAFFECVVEHLRLRSDSRNGFYGGGLTTMYLAMDSGMRVKGLINTGLIGGLFGIVMDKLMGNWH